MKSAWHAADRRELMDRSAPWPVHPAFGTLSSATWGVLVYRHTDHDLKQFGV
jgi:hypothetical protein